jgi:hypothetical protein
MYYLIWGVLVSSFVVHSSYQRSEVEGESLDQEATEEHVRARESIRQCHRNWKTDAAHRSNKPQRSKCRHQHSDLTREKLKLLTPPEVSCTTNTNPPRLPLYAAHRSYSVARLTPFCSRLYTKFHVSTSCNRGGTSNRISSANAFVNSFALCLVEGLYPDSESGVSGGGWKGDRWRRGGVYTPSILLSTLWTLLSRLPVLDCVLGLFGSCESRRRSPDTAYVTG